jgi:hydrogenase maturation protein HypF
MVCEYARFERRYHLRYVPLAGGDAGAREPWRAALAWLREAGLRKENAPALQSVDEKHLRVVERMLERRFGTVDTSSCGRLFDAVAALLGVCLENRYEAEAAMELESIAAPDDGDPFGFEISDDEIDLRQAIRDLVVARRGGASVESLSSRFHTTLARAIVAACASVRATEHLDRVCLSGGSFQNMRLLEQTVRELDRAGFQVFWQSQIPPNDGGLSLGQAVVARAML